jgi:hypothetical protein
MFSGMPKSVRELTLTLPSELHVGSWSPNGLLNFQSAIARIKTHFLEEFFILLEKVLKRRCLKWARIAHLDIRNTSYDQKKGHESK